MGLTKAEVRTLIIIERTTASISVTATLILLTSYIFIKPFRTLSNTLIFYASFANIFANVAALIGGSALTKLDGGLCQFQGFLLEMFMQSDPMWSCAMAVNVYLVFFRRYDAARLKKLYWYYGLICYGLPFIPAMFCLFYKTKSKGKMYGNATLWCWIDNDWAPIRIYSYYAPIWIAIPSTFIIYIRVGVEIWQKRSELKAAQNNYSGTLDSFSDSKSPFTGLRTTEIHVTTDPWENATPTPPSAIYHSEKRLHVPIHRDQYSISISSPAPRVPPKPSMFKRPSSMDKIKWAYAKCALLFAISILITWVPASVNRVYGLRYPKNPSFALNVGSALVLPLQGFWNTIIYFATSLSICRKVWADFKQKRQWKKAGKGLNIVHLGGRREEWETKGRVAPMGLKGKDSDSAVELSRKRTPTSDGESF